MCPNQFSFRTFLQWQFWIVWYTPELSTFSFDLLPNFYIKCSFIGPFSRTVASTHSTKLEFEMHVTLFQCFLCDHTICSMCGVLFTGRPNSPWLLMLSTEIWSKLIGYCTVAPSNFTLNFRGQFVWKTWIRSQKIA